MSVCVFVIKSTDYF